MAYPIYQVDAFADKIFKGNPAAVCPLQNWLPEKILQAIAMENNLAETAFIVKKNGVYEIRWFTPLVEVDLCGHATLAAAHVMFEHEGYKETVIQFYSPRSGDLSVSKKGNTLSLNFPADDFREVPVDEAIKACFNHTPIEAYQGKTDYMLVFKKEDEIVNIIPDLMAIAKLIVRGVIITARGENCDFVSRFFAPQSGIDEDPVTGSAHTTLIPYWAKKLEKTLFNAVQLSPRKGYLTCELSGDRVVISGEAKTFMKGEFFLDQD